jgi:hypothetical protein
LLGRFVQEKGARFSGSSRTWAPTDPTKGSFVFSIVNPTGAVVRHLQVGSVATKPRGWMGYSSELRVENGSTLRGETKLPNFNVTDAKPLMVPRLGCDGDAPALGAVVPPVRRMSPEPLKSASFQFDLDLVEGPATGRTLEAMATAAIPG